jgi:tripartite-type tricarboxylate transporter receptor subunit TctC
MAFASLPSVLGHLKSGKLVAIGVSSPKRSPTLPDVPAIGEKVPGYAGTVWIGLFAPRGIPAGRREEDRAGHGQGARRSRRRSNRSGAKACELATLTPAQFASLLQDDIAHWAKVVKASGATVD